MGKVITCSDNLTYVLTNSGSMTSNAYFDVYVGEAVSPSGFYVFHHGEFEIGEERYILLSSGVGYINVGKIRGTEQ